jgi:hypothetical protein
MYETRVSGIELENNYLYAAGFVFAIVQGNHQNDAVTNQLVRRRLGAIPND